jgi:hypothetical protein
MQLEYRHATRNAASSFLRSSSQRVVWGVRVRALSSRSASVSTLRFKFGNSLQGLLSQGQPFTSDSDLASAFDAWHATVKRDDKLVQVAELARSIRFDGLLLAGHQSLLEPFTPASPLSGCPTGADRGHSGHQDL